MWITFSNWTLKSSKVQKNSSRLYKNHIFFPLHVACFSNKKKGTKGFMFITGDEDYYDVVSKEQVRSIIGDSISEDITAEATFEELKVRFRNSFQNSKLYLLINSEFLWNFKKRDILQWYFYFKKIPKFSKISNSFSEKISRFSSPQDIQCEASWSCHYKTMGQTFGSFLCAQV